MTNSPSETGTGVSRCKTSKVMSMTEAISKYVRDGDLLYLAGFTHLIPFAAAHEIIRQGKKDLVLARATPDLVYDQMIAAGCARKVMFSWAGNPGVGPLRAFRKKVEAGELEIEEYTHFGTVARLMAGAGGLSFFPLKTNAGSDLVKKNPAIKSVVCPYTGREISVVPALNPDVAVIHVQRADPNGNGQIWGIVGEQREAAFASRCVILTAEEIVSEDVIRSDPARTLIPGFLVSAVVEEPWGAHPSYAQGYYDRDNRFYLEWEAISKDEARLAEWLQEWVFGVGGRKEYVSKLESSRILSLIPKSQYSAPVDYGIYL